MSRNFNMLFLSLAITAVSVAAFADAPEEGKQAEIHFANSGGIFNWQAAGNQALYIEARDHRWYLAKLLSPCLTCPLPNMSGSRQKPTAILTGLARFLSGTNTARSSL